MFSIFSPISFMLIPPAVVLALFFVQASVISQMKWLENEAIVAMTDDDRGIRGSGRNFDFCYGSDGETRPPTKIKGVMIPALSLSGA
jgi:hypothetical protein